MSSINLTDVNTALNLVSAALPEFGVAYQILKTIWTRTNPGKTEDDYRTYLRSTAQTNIDDTAALLRADGYVEDPVGSGNWHKPAPPA